MSDEIAIKVEHVSKIFKLPHEKTTSVKDMVVNSYRRKKTFESQTVLKDVSFEIKKGEFVGIVGRNGSGKSTLLKILSGIYTPSEGSVHTYGMLTPFIELGVGFNHELTGRENVYLNGALLGFNRTEMQAMYSDIVAFAELEKFMDQKLKNYSSGMQVRLAFSIAIRAKSDILVLDEVLAVGDEAFQQKCVDVFERYKANGQTVVLVTHDMESVRRFCSRAILINNGVIEDDGQPNKIATKYSDLNKQHTNEIIEEEIKDVPVSPIIVTTHNQAGKKTKVFKGGDVLNVRVSWPKSLMGVLNTGVAIIKNDGQYVFGANTLNNPPKLTSHKIDYSVQLNLGPGKYYLMVGLFGKSKYDQIEFMEYGPEFIIESDPEETEHGLARLNYDWSN